MRDDFWNSPPTFGTEGTYGAKPVRGQGGHRDTPGEPHLQEAHGGIGLRRLRYGGCSLHGSLEDRRRGIAPRGRGGEKKGQREENRQEVKGPEP